MPAGDKITGDVEMADARGVIIKREDGNNAWIPVGDMIESDAALLQSWLATDNKPAAFAEVKETLIRTKVGALAFDRAQIQAAPGELVMLKLQNDEDLQHNLILCSEPTKEYGQELAMRAMALAGEGMAKEWIPDGDGILAATRMVDPHQGSKIYFRAPMEVGKYAYVCTFPGHAMVMNGLMIVGEPEDDNETPLYSDVTYSVYQGKWQKLPDWSTLTPVKEGKQVGKLDATAFELKNNYGIVWKGTFNAPADGEYDFFLNSDDGSRLSVNGNEIAIFDGIHGKAGTPKTGKATLKAGANELVIEYFQGGGHIVLSVAASGPELELTSLTPDNAKGDEKFGIPLYPENGEAMIYRNFITGIDDARGIAVGFSEGVHYGYDASNGRLAIAWRGGYIDAKRHWTGRGQGYQPPSAKTTAIAPGVQSLAVLDDVAAEWPSDDFVKNSKSRKYSGPERTASGYTFGGYELNAKRQPTFLWSWRDIEVTDFISPSASGELKREITLKGKAPSSGSLLYYLGQQGSGLQVQLEGAELVTTGKDNRAKIDLSSGQATLVVHYTF